MKVPVYIRSRSPAMVFHANTAQSPVDLLTPLSDVGSLTPPASDPGTGGYEEVGLQLLESMKCYERHLKMDLAPMSSLSPSEMNTKISPQGEAARSRVIKLAQQILDMTMDPKINLLINSLSFHFCTCLKVAVDLSIAERIPKYGQMRASDLSRLTGAQEALLVRIMRVLTSKNVFAEIQDRVYSHTTMSWTICEENQKYLISHRLNESFRSASRQADALRLNGYREPEIGDRCGFNLAFQTDDNFWRYITERDPVLGQNFDHAMKTVNLNHLGDIPGLYPFNRLVEKGGLIVDVGGGQGQVARTILASYPNSPLRCIVQDRFSRGGSAAVGISCHDREAEGGGLGKLTFQQHNFFDPQPVKGAAAYLFRHIFHDWPNSACREILKQTVAAMDEKNSCILICDQIMGPPSSSIPCMLYDIDMMSLFGGKERTFDEWDALIKGADKRLRIASVKISPNTTSSIMEIKLGQEME